MLTVERAELVAVFDHLRTSADVRNSISQVTIQFHSLGNEIQNTFWGWKDPHRGQDLVRVQAIETTLHCRDMIGVGPEPVGA